MSTQFLTYCTGGSYLRKCLVVLQCPICSGRTASSMASSSMISVAYNISIASVTVGDGQEHFVGLTYNIHVSAQAK